MRYNTSTSHNSINKISVIRSAYSMNKKEKDNRKQKGNNTHRKNKNMKINKGPKRYEQKVNKTLVGTYQKKRDFEWFKTGNICQ